MSTTNTTTTLDAVNEIVLEIVPELGAPVGPADRISDLGVDSLSFVDILFKIEKVFGISIGDGELERIESVQDIMNLIDR
jgi:acyl carrier protein